MYLWTNKMGILISLVFSRSDFLWSEISVSPVLFTYKENEHLLLKHLTPRSFRVGICLIWYSKEISRTSLFSYYIKEKSVKENWSERANSTLRRRSLSTTIDYFFYLHLFHLLIQLCPTLLQSQLPGTYVLRNSE